jgi:hypothetical protein
MAKYIDDNSDSFVDINDFDLEDNRANIKEPDDNNRDPIIPLSNIGGTSLNTIDKEDEAPIFGPILKKTTRGTRILLIK